MALTGLEIFKLLPKTNCKKCGMPTCLAFAMQLAQKRAELNACPYVSEQAKQTLAAAAAPPIRLVKFGRGSNQLQVGQETVMFRHEEKFYNPTVIGVTISDKLTGDDLKKRIESVNSLKFERVGTKIAVKAIAVINDSGSAANFAQAAAAVKNAGSLAIILVTDSPDAMAAAVDKTADATPLLASAKTDTAEAMAKIAKNSKCPIVAKAESIDALAELTEKIKAQGVEDIVLCPQTKDLSRPVGKPLEDSRFGTKKVVQTLRIPHYILHCRRRQRHAGCYGHKPYLQILKYRGGRYRPAARIIAYADRSNECIQRPAKTRSGRAEGICHRRT